MAVVPSCSRYVSWAESVVRREGGSKAIHYYLKRSDGRADLAIVGRENKPYRCVLRRRSMYGLGDSGEIAKRLKNRSDVINWLDSVVSGSRSVDHSVEGRLQSHLDSDRRMYKDTLKPSNLTEGFLWLGSSWTCRKMRKHYPSFRRRGIKISVHEFVFVLSEDYKRLVAFIEDMYEDSQGNKMVVVRWLHKVDEVGLHLSRTCSDREIFFSLFLQDLSIECIDGTATVLSPDHFDKCMKEVVSGQAEPFVCYELFDEDEAKPFDITRVKGYWNQPLLKHIFPALPPKPHVKPRFYDSSEEVERNAEQDTIVKRPQKKLRISEPSISEEQRKLTVDSAADCSEKLIKGNLPLPLSVGCAVEVLSQDSGMRGCWFRATILKVSKEKVKVRYDDIVDVCDEENKLQEWVSASKLAASDELGLRFNGRRTIRPLVRLKEHCLHAISAGTVVDAWWFDGWWEGIVLREQGEEFHVFFPGEKREAVVPRKDLRHSQEWLGKRWVPVNERPEVASKLLELLQTKDSQEKSGNDEVEMGSSHSDTNYVTTDKRHVIEDLCADIRLKWKSSRKRVHRRRKDFLKIHPENRKPNSGDIGRHVCDDWPICPFFKVDKDKCKFMSDPLFSHSVVPSLSNLVLSR